MQPSMFNVRVPLETAPGTGDVFLMNTFTDAQVIVSSDVASLLDRLASDPAARLTDEEHGALATLAEHGFVVDDRQTERTKV